MDILGVERNFHSLSVRDLLAARDQYHYHLIGKKNVVGTAIGLYLIRKEDPWPDKHRSLQQIGEERAKDERPKGERTFENSEVREYSWPCVLVLVDDWIKSDHFGAAGHQVKPQEFIPDALYLPDGRTVPVCVVRIKPAQDLGEVLPKWHWPDTLLGGGFPVITKTQQRVSQATVGCLVTDGHTTYALTNRHVCGPAGERMYSVLRGKETAIGVSSDKQLTRMEFGKVYSEYPERRSYCALDVGLIELDDVREWTSQVYGIGEIGALADLSEYNISLKLINAQVVGYGAVSGEVKGRIQALFYRFKSVGGYDYISDFLIAPEEGAEVQTGPGNSGMIWHLVPQKKGELPRPLAVEWGGQAILQGAAENCLHFALGTSLSNVCRLLDVELVRDHNTGVRPYWGTTGHYGIATYACGLVTTPALKQLIGNNLDRISYDRESLDPKWIKEQLKAAKKEGQFVALSDVSDVVFKNTDPPIEGGRDPRPRSGPEHPAHYADLDLVPKGEKNKRTFREICLQDPSKVSVAEFQKFYDGLEMKGSSRGTLPFRVWQIYEAMVDYASQRDIERFVCAAGILSHYAADAGQPLHGSYLADGRKEEMTTEYHERRDGKGQTKVQKWPGKGVHSAYEDKMIDDNAEELYRFIEQALRSSKEKPEPVKNGKEAALRTIELMDRTANRLPPGKIVEAYIKTGGGKSKKVSQALWEEFGEQTGAAMADSARVLAMLWECAWKAGTGTAKIDPGKLKAIDKQTLFEIYAHDPDFIRSLDLDNIGSALKPARHGVAAD